MHFLEVLADRRALGQRPAVDAQDRHLARGVPAQEIRVLLPVALLDQFHLQPLLCEAEAHLAAERR